MTRTSHFRSAYVACETGTPAPVTQCSLHARPTDRQCGTPGIPKTNSDLIYYPTVTYGPFAPPGSARYEPCRLQSAIMMDRPRCGGGRLAWHNSFIGMESR